MRNNRTYFQEEFHGFDGPIKYIHMQEYGPVQQYWHGTMNEVGIETSPDNVWEKCWSLEYDEYY